jgi:hypothetical protein
MKQFQRAALREFSDHKLMFGDIGRLVWGSTAFGARGADPDGAMGWGLDVMFTLAMSGHAPLPKA